MEVLDQMLSQGTLSDLTRLEQRAQQLETQQNTLYSKLTSLQTLQSRLVQLRARRDQLRASKAAKPQGPLSLLEGKMGGDSSLSARQRELRLKKHKLEEQKAAYRLLGQSLSVVDQRTVRLCIDTCYDGQYASPQYVELKMSHKGASVTRHTLPPYVPLDDTQTLLTAGIGPFSRHVQDHLQAQALRKGFVQEVQEEHRSCLSEDVQMTPSGDWVRLSFTSVPQCGGAAILIQLKYDELTSWLPTRAKISIQAESDDEDTPSQDEVSNISNLFKTNDLPNAVYALVGR